MRTLPTFLVGVALLLAAPVAYAQSRTSGTNKQETGQVRGITAEHNKVRAAVGAAIPPLTWNAKLAAGAQKWAKSLTENCTFTHDSTLQGVGENIAARYGEKMTGAQIAQQWAQEKAHFVYGPFRTRMLNKAGHYSQMVWRDTEQLGCAVAPYKSHCPLVQQWGPSEVWVCRYSPPGNVHGEKPY